MSLAAEVIETLRQRGATVATAESLTGGLVCASLVDVPGASDVVRGGVVAYAADVKSALLSVDPAVIDRVGTVDPSVAEAMARGVRPVLGATWGISTTGVAGPGPAEGKDAGTVCVAVSGDGVVRHRLVHCSGDRAEVRHLAVEACLSLLLATLGEQSADSVS